MKKQDHHQMSKQMKKQRIIDELLVELSDSIKIYNDLTTLENLLQYLPNKILLSGLSEEGKKINWNEPSPFGSYDNKKY